MPLRQIHTAPTTTTCDRLAALGFSTNNKDIGIMY